MMWAIHLMLLTGSMVVLATLACVIRPTPDSRFTAPEPWPR